MIHILLPDDHCVVRTGHRRLLDRLTRREFEVLRMAACGDAAAHIAVRMHLSPKTVLNHLSAIRQKLGADNDFKLLRLAMRHGLVDAAAELSC